MSSGPKQFDVILVGAGHNGLVAATFLARAGLSVVVLERAPVIGGAVRTEYPFPKAPDVAQSTGAYLLGLMPPELIQKLGVDIPVMRRDPHYFLPTTGERYLLFGSDRAETQRQYEAFFSRADWEADERLQAELEVFRQDLHATWLTEPLSIEETAERYVRASHREAFVNLCRGSVGDYLERFGFKSDLIKAMYAVTDGFSGLYGTWDTPGTGMNFLVHNMCRLPGSEGTWMIAKGGMGAVTQTIGKAAQTAGAEIITSAEVTELDIEAGRVRGVSTRDGQRFTAKAVMFNADPFRMGDLLGDVAPAEFRERTDGWRMDGSTMKINMCLSAPPRFSCLPEDRGQHSATIHILPDEAEVMASLDRSFNDVKAGRLPEFPTIEWYIHSTVDPSLCDAKGQHSSALFVQWVPYELSESTWEAEETRYVEHLLSVVDRFAPGTSDLVVDTFTLTPPKIEAHFGITRGHIHHVDNSFGYSDRVPYRVPVEGVYACGAGCHPAGSVIGAAGHNAAMALIADMGLQL